MSVPPSIRYTEPEAGSGGPLKPLQSEQQSTAVPSEILRYKESHEQPKTKKSKGRRADQRIATRARYISNTLEVLAWVVLIGGVIGMFAAFVYAGQAGNGELVTFGGFPYSEEELNQIGIFTIIGSFLVFVWFHFLSNVSAYLRFKTEE